jgi:tetratricopeptide (TPR) repeat protein
VRNGYLSYKTFPSIKWYSRGLTESIYKVRAYALYGLGEFEDALADINLAIRAGGTATSPGKFYLAGDIHVGMGNYDSALRAYQDGLEIALMYENGNRVRHKGVDITRSPTKEESENLSIIHQFAGRNEAAFAKRLDPVVLPAEIFEIILQHVIYDNATDEDFALRCGWVSQAWRNSTRNMPSIWRSYTYKPESEDEPRIEKSAFWIDRARKRGLQEVRMVHPNGPLPLTGGLAVVLKFCLRKATTLVFQGTMLSHRRSVGHLAEVISSSRFLKVLRIEASRLPQTYSQHVDLGLFTAESAARIEELRVAGVNLVRPRNTSAPVVSAGVKYHALRNLTIERCDVDF